MSKDKGQLYLCFKAIKFIITYFTELRFNIHTSFFNQINIGRLAEWLRRWTHSAGPSVRVSSNPTFDILFFARQLLAQPLTKLKTEKVCPDNKNIRKNN